tara:strand:+ start:2688 stop:3641 length:954 start_codon:yes stop_codon:yes gene_type:complete
MIINPSTLTSGIKVIPSDSINIPGPIVKYSGVTTSVVANKLPDTTAPLRGGFVQTIKPAPNQNQILNQGVQVGDVVYNMSDGTTGTSAGSGIAYVTAVDSNSVLSLSANIFTASGDAYAIYEGNGINVDQDWGWKLVVEDITTETVSTFISGTDSGGARAIVPSGGTYIGNATFTMTVAGGAGVAVVTAVNIATTGDFDEVDPIGKTITFNAATINALNPGTGTGTGDVTCTFVGSNTTFVPQPSELGQSKSFQLYVGATGDAYVTTNMGEEIFIESIPAGTILPIAVARVNVGVAAAAGNGFKQTLTSATEIVALT